MAATALHSMTTQCLICEADNVHSAILCKECSAPMVLVHESVAQERQPQIISVIGESNVGKTVYLGFLLDMLSRRAGDFESIPKGSFSVDLAQNVVSSMNQRRFPPKTPMEPNQWYWAYHQVRRTGARPGQWFDLVMPDMAGESVTAEIDAPNTFKVIRGLMTRSAGLMLLVDAALAASGSARPDFYALKIMSYLDAIYATKRNQYNNVPIAVLLCKSDHCPEAFDSPARLAEANLNRLWNLCRSRFTKVEFFACSAVGALGYATGENPDFVRPTPLHTALRGILEPFQWLTEQI
jgi:hypothetical protein